MVGKGGGRGFKGDDGGREGAGGSGGEGGGVTGELPTITNKTSEIRERRSRISWGFIKGLILYALICISLSSLGESLLGRKWQFLCLSSCVCLLN